MNRSFISKSLALIIGVICISIAYNHNKNVIYETNGSIYGTYWKLISTDYISDNLRKDIKEELLRIDNIASNYNNFSELSLINNAQIHKRLKISKELYEILLFAEQLNKISMGYYDVTVGLTVSKNGFGPPIDLNQTFIHKSIDRFKLLDGYYLIKYDNFLFDLSSIAKGYAVDKIHDLLITKGIKNFLFDIGGELIINGSKHKQNWKIGIQNPLKNINSPIIEIETKNYLSVATSGEYRNYKINPDGKIVTHTVNPIINEHINNDVLSVSVTSYSSNMKADAWATALNALGPELGLSIANEHEISVIYIIKLKDEIIFKKSNWWIF